MSYSNDWSISGISGLTNLKDCYQEEGVSILRKAGCPRLEDGTPNRLNPNDNFHNRGFAPRAGEGNYLKWYDIPNYSINDKNIIAYGSLTHAIDEGYGFQFNKPLSYFGAWSASWTSSNAKRGNYVYYPLVLADNLTDYRPDGVTQLARNDAQNAGIISSYDNFNSSNLRVKYIPNSILKSLYKVEEDPLQIQSVDIDIDTISYLVESTYNFPKKYDRSTGYNVYYFTFNQSTASFGTTSGMLSDQNNNYCPAGDLIRYNYIFKTNIPNLTYTKINGETIPTNNLKKLLFIDDSDAKEIYGFGQYDCSPYQLDVQDPVNELNYAHNFCVSGTNMKYKNVTYIETVSEYINCYLGWYYYRTNINPHPKDSIYSYKYTSHQFVDVQSSYLLCQSIFLVVPQYKGFDATRPSHSYYYINENFSNYDYYYTQDNQKTYCYKVTKGLNTNHSNHRSSSTSTTYTYTSHAIRYNASEYIEASNGTTYNSSSSSSSQGQLEMVKGFYNGTLTLPFPYDNSSNRSVLSIYAPNSVNGSQHKLENPKSTQIIRWSGGDSTHPYYLDGQTETGDGRVKDGIVYIDQSGGTDKTYLPMIRHTGNNTTLALDFSLELAAKNDSVPPRRAIVGFVTEPIGLELTSDHHNYELKHKYSANIIDQYPLSMEVTFYFVDGEQTVNLTFTNNIWSGENGPHKITTYGRNITYFYENSRKDFESTGVSLIHSVARYTNDRYTEVESTSSNYDPKGFGVNTSYYQLTDIISVGDKLLLEGGNGDIEIEVGQSRFSSYVYAAGGGYWNYFVYDSQLNRLFSGEDVNTSEYEYQEYESFNITSMTLYKYFEKVEENVSNYNPEGYTDEESQPIYAGYYQLNSGVITGITPRAQIAVPLLGTTLTISVSPSSSISRSNYYRPDNGNTYQACYDPINHRVYITHYYDGGEESWDSYYAPNIFAITIF